MLERLGRCGPSLPPGLGLARQLSRPVQPCELEREQIVRDGEGIQVLRLDRELLESLGELVVCSFAAHDFASHVHGIVLPADLCKPLEGSLQARGALCARFGFEPPLDQFGRDDAPPTQSIAQLDISRAHRLASHVGELGQRGQRLVASIELVGQNSRELSGEDARLRLVSLHLDPFGQELGVLFPLLRLFAEVAETRQRVEVLRIGGADDLQRPDGARRLVELFVKPREAPGDGRTFGRLGDELELALERVCRRSRLVARLLQISHCLQSGSASGIELLEQSLVPLDGRVDVSEAFGEQLRLAKSHPNALLRIRRCVAKAAQEHGRFVGIAPLDRVFHQMLERFFVVAVLEHVEPGIPCRVLVRELLGVEGSSLTPRRDALALVGQTVGAPGEQLRQFEPVPAGRVQLAQPVRVLVARGIEVGRPTQARDDARFCAGPRKMLGRAGEMSRLMPSVAGELREMDRTLASAGPLPRHEEAPLGRPPEPAVSERLGGFGVSLSRAQGIAQPLPQLAEALEQHAARKRIRHGRRVVGNDPRGTLDGACLLEQLRSRDSGLFVAWGEPGDALPGLGRRRRIAPLLFVHRGDSLLERDLFFGVALGLRLLF